MNIGKIAILDGYTSTMGEFNWDALKTLGEVEAYDRTPKDKIIERASGAVAVLTNKVPMFKEQIDALPDLKYIGVLATGYNNVDLQCAKSRGIAVTNIAGYSTDSVAQEVFAHILNISNMVEEHAESVRAGDWAKSPDICYCIRPITEIAGKTLGIIGYGTIGKKVAKIGIAFGMKVAAYSPSKPAGTCDGPVEFKTLDELFCISDVISLNCVLNDSTKEIINASNISKMKNGAWIINTGRGGLINERDLADALNSGKIGAAGLDVLSTEPPSADNPLISSKNSHITPHIAWTTREARQRLIQIAFENLKSWAEGGNKNRIC